MNPTVVGMMATVAALSALYLDAPEHLKDIYVETLAEARLVSTAGDLKSIAVMLDAGYVMDRRLPGENEFDTWLADTFKHNNVKDLAVDHWGNRYVYTVTGERSYEIRSAGPDGRLDTGDDLLVRGP